MSGYTRKSGLSSPARIHLFPAAQRFFRPSTELRRLMLLRLLEISPLQSQAQLGRSCGLTPAIVNRYIDGLHAEGLIKIEPVNKRDLSYELTDRGRELSRELLDEFSSEVSRSYTFMRSVLERRLSTLLEGRSVRVALFGSGATCEILIMSLIGFPNAQLVAIVDYDQNKIGKPLFTYMVSSPAVLSAVLPDMIIVASWSMKRQILETISSLSLPSHIKVTTL